MLTESYIKIEKTLKDVGFSSVVECIRYHGKHLGDREAVVFASFYGNREVVTWNDLLNKSTAVAKSLVNLGVKPGDFVGIKLRSCPEWLYLAFGTMMAGACTGSISFRFRDGSDLVATMEKMEKCNVLVMDPGERGQNWATIKSLLDEYSPDGAVRSRKLPTLKYLFGYEKDGENYMKGVKNVNDLIAETHEDVTLPEIRPTDNAVTFQTSGSTGTPKLVVHTHSNLLYVCQLVSEDTKFYLDSTCVNFNDRPFTWLGGFPWSVISGQKRVTISAFETVPEDRVPGIIKIIVEEKCTTMSALQPVIHELVDRKDEIPADWPMEMLIFGGQPLTNSLQEAIGIVAPSMCNGYGGTEFFGVASGVISNKSDFKEYWCGKVSANGNMEVKLVDENEQIVPVNTRGEIYVRSAGVFSGYLNDPEKTAAVKTPDGWYKTDDIGMLTEDGELYVFGRKSNMIISGNVNIAPDMLERTLEQHPGVDKAIVVPIPDKVLYQVPCACVVREKGNDVSEEQLRAFCDDTINDKSGLYTVPPQYYLFFDKFPETMSGKISRPAVIEKALGLIEVNT